MSAPAAVHAQTLGSLIDEGIHADDREEVAALLQRLRETMAEREQVRDEHIKRREH